MEAGETLLLFYGIGRRGTSGKGIMRMEGREVWEQPGTSRPMPRQGVGRVDKGGHKKKLAQSLSGPVSSLNIPLIGFFCQHRVFRNRFV